MATIGIRQIEAGLDDISAREPDEDIASLEKGNQQEEIYLHCKQRISADGRILVSKKGWAMRVITIAALIFIMVYNVTWGWRTGDPLIIYAVVAPIHTLLVFIVGWCFFKNKRTRKIPEDLVSVIIPVYNQEKLIGEVLEAIFRSSYHNLEVVAVNDGSKDRSGLLLDLFAKEFPKLRVIHQSNGGKRSAVAAGFYASRGRFVVLIDSDSVVDEKAIEEFMKTFKADPEVGGVVANGKVLNADKNFITKCQDSWYDYAFNIHKTTESMFGTVLCCSGCLAAYRREAIARFIPFWASAKVQNSDDRDLTSYTYATPWAKTEMTSGLSGQLLKAMSQYDDAEDRSLTAQTLTSWKTVYVPTAVVYTEVPDRFRTYIRQQIRWKKGYIRSCFYVSAFFWKKNPLISLVFYTEFMSTFIFPLLLFSIYFYAPIMYHLYWIPLSYWVGQMLFGLAAGFDYKFRQSTAKNWKYKPFMNIIASTLLPWLVFPALWTFRKNRWLTR